MAKTKHKTIKAKTFNAAVPATEQYVIRVVENVPADEVDQLIVDEQQTNPKFLKADKLPEGDGEYTVVLYYRR